MGSFYYGERNRTMKKILTIAGSDSGGGAGIQADLKTFSAFNVYGTCAITALTAQNTKSIEGVFNIPSEFVAKQIDAVMNDINPRVWKTGMLANSKIIDVIVDKVKFYKIKSIVVDPVMIAKSGDFLLSQEAKSSLIKKLIQCAYIITPNCQEAEALSGIQINTVEDMKQSAIIIHNMGAKNVVIKGGHLKNNPYAIDIMYDGKTFRELSSRRLKTKNTHGTGCTFASAIAAGVAKRNTVFTAVKNAKKHINVLIKRSSYLRIGYGFGPLI